MIKRALISAPKSALSKSKSQYILETKVYDKQIGYVVFQ